MVALVHAGRTPEELATEFEPTAQSIRNWVPADDGAVAGLCDVQDGARFGRGLTVPKMRAMAPAGRKLA